MPGTGKTATVLRVINRLRKESKAWELQKKKEEEGGDGDGDDEDDDRARGTQSITGAVEMPSFHFVQSNGMQLTHPNQIYSILWKVCVFLFLSSSYTSSFGANLSHFIWMDFVLCGLVLVLVLVFN